MAEELNISGTSREEKYEALIPQLKALIGDEKDWIANLANTSAALKQTFDFFWVGFYLVKEDSLVLGPFQGTVACTRIAMGRGVCGTAWHTKQIQLVPNVEEFPGHIACSAESKSEVVIPLFKNGEVIAVLDVDSDALDDFSEVDVHYLSKICAWLETL